jgi:ABC-type uncharacterized transport system YnjBCD substrate-binding protein
MRFTRLMSLAGAALAASFMTTPAGAATVNVVTAGDQNMADYVRDYLAPKFQKTNPGVTINVFGTGPGDAGSQKIFEKLEAQQKANTATYDIDVAVVHQKMGGQMVAAGMLEPYRTKISTGKLVSRDTAVNALGVNVDGFVMPMFHSQTALAYNSDLLKNPPKSYDELKSWVKDHPKQFGYNGIKNGMSGVAFVVGWIYAYGGNMDTLMKGPYDKAAEASWDKAYADLKEFNKYVTFTPGNAGTMDMLNRGEIAMGPVWVDMFYTWMADGKLPPSVKLALPEPGMPGQPMFYVIPNKAANKDLAMKFVELATSPEVQAEGIVKKFNWYPGIDADHLKNALDQAVWNKLFADVSPQDLAKKGQPFPIVQYFNAITEGYEKKVSN